MTMKYLTLLIMVTAVTIFFPPSVNAGERVKIMEIGGKTSSKYVSRKVKRESSTDLGFMKRPGDKPDFSRNNQTLQGYDLTPGWEADGIQIDLLSGFLYLGSENQYTDMPSAVMPPEMYKWEFQDGPKLIRFKGVAR